MIPHVVELNIVCSLWYERDLLYPCAFELRKEVTPTLHVIAVLRNMFFIVDLKYYCTIIPFNTLSYIVLLRHKHFSTDCILYELLMFADDTYQSERLSGRVKSVQLKRCEMRGIKKFIQTLDCTICPRLSPSSFQREKT